MTPNPPSAHRALHRIEVAKRGELIKEDQDRAFRPRRECGHVAACRLATPDEIMPMNADDILLLRQGQHPPVVGKIRYYAEREFAGLYDPA